MGGHSVLRHTCVSTKKVPCTAAAAGAPWASFVAAVDEVARALLETDMFGYLVFRYPDTAAPYPGNSRLRFS